MAALRCALLIVLLVAGTAFGAWAAPRLAGPATYATTVADVELEIGVSRPSQRGVDLYVPLADWGLRAQLVDAPLRVSAEPRRLNRSGIVRTVSSDEQAAIAELRSELDAALRSLALRTALLSLLGGLLGGGLVALAWYAAGVRGRRLVLAPIGAVGLVALVGGGLAAWSAATFDPTRLDQPSYYASGIELERILDQADSLRASGTRYSDNVDNSLRAISGLLDDRAEPAVTRAGTPPADRSRRRLVLASDPHNNLLTLPSLRRYADGAPVVFAGDFTINGGKIETPFLGSMADVSATIVAVSGNHDSPGIMRALQREGVTVLERADGVREIGGFRMAGFEDPLEFAAGEFPDGIRAGMSASELEDGDRFLRQAKDEQWRRWQQLPERPQVLIMHQESLGRDLARRIEAADPDGAPLTILVGHTHRQRIDRYGPVTVVNSGSIGAGGLFGVNEQSVGLALLDFQGAQNQSTATTLISQNPATTAAQARRVVTAEPDCDDAVVFCHEPDEEETIEDQPGDTASPTPTPG